MEYLWNSYGSHYALPERDTAIALFGIDFVFLNIMKAESIKHCRRH